MDSRKPEIIPWVTSSHFQIPLAPFILVFIESLTSFEFSSANTDDTRTHLWGCECFATLTTFSFIHSNELYLASITFSTNTIHALAEICNRFKKHTHSVAVSPASSKSMNSSINCIRKTRDVSLASMGENHQMNLCIVNVFVNLCAEWCLLALVCV